MDYPILELTVNDLGLGWALDLGLSNMQSQIFQFQSSTVEEFIFPVR